jgi:CRP-like cAMP-binding protein
MAQFQQSNLCNRLLGAMTPADFALLQPHLERVPLNLREVVIPAGEPIQHVYFVERGITSVLAEIAQDRIEIGMVGPEGMAGVAVVLGVESSPHSFMVQAEGEALRIPALKLQAVMSRSPSLSAMLTRYVHCFLVQVSQTAYANGDFGLEARLARWVLMTQDRLDRDELPLTHEFLSLMLGVRRPGVTTATHVLEGNGMIRAQRGRITVLDREKLMDLADTSYGLPEAEYARVMGLPLSRMVVAGERS